MEKEKQILQELEKVVQGLFNTEYGKIYFTRLAIMSDFFSDSLVASTRLKANTMCDAPLTYLEAQRDLARKTFNCLTSQQFAELRDSVLDYLFKQNKPTK